jgi:uncharacterized protein YlxW (UPF0749 family)
MRKLTLPTQTDQDATLLVRIAKLEQLLEELRSESEVMDDEIHAIERDLQALRMSAAMATY